MRMFIEEHVMNDLVQDTENVKFGLDFFLSKKIKLINQTCAMYCSNKIYCKFCGTFSWFSHDQKMCIII